MKSSAVRRVVRLAARAVLPVLAFGSVPLAQSATISLADQPLFSTVSVPGNLTLALSVEWPTATTPAYPSTTSYSTSSTFLGYFDPAKCYKYQVVANGTDYSGSYFYPASAASSHTCSGSASNVLWSGNYLNWASMQTLDAFRWVLTGGYRSTDTSTLTILTKTYAAQDSGVMPQKSIASGLVSGATPFNWSSGITTRLRNLGTRMWIAGSSTTLVTGSATTGATAYTGQNNYTGSTNVADSAATYEIYINVKVCDTTVGAESNCTAYGTSSKPEGLMQKYASKLRYAAFGYYNHSGDTTQQRDGGVMRARMNYIGPTKPVPGSSDITNPLNEWSSTDGTMVVNPDPTDASATVSFATTSGYTVSIGNSGVMNYLNKFGYSAQSYKSKDPVSELYYAAQRYFRNLGNVASYTTLSGAGSGATGNATAAKWLDGFPAITTWDDPIIYSCQKNFILGIGDVNTHRDADLPSSTLLSSLEPSPQPSEVTADTTVNVAKATNMVGQLEGYNGSLGNIYGDQGNGTCPGTSSQCDTYYIAGLAYDAHTNDIRNDLTGTQTINTYWMDVLENQVYKHKNQYWLAAKYGGFDVPQTFSPYAPGNNTTTITSTAWDNNSDTLTPGSASGTLTYSTDTTTDPRPDNYFPGNQPDVMQSGLTKAFAKISSEAAAADSTAFSTPSPNVTSSGAISYAASYDPQTWTGDVIGSNVTFAGDGTPTLTLLWDARSLLSAASVTATTRKIVTCCTTSTSAPGLAFTNAALTGTSLNARTYYASFGAVPGVSGTQSVANFISYLRGDTSQEIANGGIYRTRSYRLGDIVNSKPVAVAAPSFPYYDVNNPGYSSFKSTYSSRKTVVYVGANDGMLHAFDGSSSASTGGSELFAYIPSFMYGTSTTAATTGLAALGNPSFTHHYYVDATPVYADVNFKYTSGSTATANDWHTLLIGGLGKGGAGFYALDVTDPTTWTTESAVAGKVLWEFTDSHMGYSYGLPSVVKTKKYGWVVIATSGYNNSDGVGYFYIINPRTGALLESVATPTGSTSNPINLGPVSTYVPDYTDETADAIYAGDMQGNLWRVDLTATSGSYPTPLAIATLKDSSNNLQPVTTRPLVEIDTNSSKRYVMVGTGRLLADSDITSSYVQTFYAIVDGTSSFGTFYTSSTLPAGNSFPILRGKLNNDSNLLTGIGSAPTSVMGWYFDLPVTNSIGQRVNVDPTANSGVVAWIGNLPNGAVCAPSGTGTLYGVSFATGKTVLTDNSGNLIASSTPISGVLTDVSIMRVGGTLRLYTGGSTGDVVNAPANLTTATGIRQLNWRDIPLQN